MRSLRVVFTQIRKKHKVRDLCVPDRRKQCSPRRVAMWQNPEQRSAFTIENTQFIPEAPSTRKNDIHGNQYKNKTRKCTSINSTQESHQDQTPYCRCYKAFWQQILKSLVSTFYYISNWAKVIKALKMAKVTPVSRTKGDKSVALNSRL